MKNDIKTVAVVGAGIVGCSCALWLQRKGFAVILIDPQDPGSGASSGNACTIADYACVPVNSPGLLKRLPWLMFSTDSPLSVNPGYAISHLRWMIGFLRNCSAQKVAEITDILGKLLAKTYQGLDPLIEMADAQDLFRQQGCMYVYNSQRGFQNAAADNKVRRQNGVHFDELNAVDIRELEPNLKIPFVKGLLFNTASQVVNPQSLTMRYFECLLANQGRSIRQRVLEVKHEQGPVQLYLDNGECLEVNKAVIAAGAFSKNIKGTGAQGLPLDTERGYHVQYKNMQHLLNRPVCWSEAGFYATPMDQGLRVVGTVEIAGYGTQKNSRNLNYLVSKGRQMLDLPGQYDQDWLGFRPTMPDALPVIGCSPGSDNILFAFGHQHIGLTLAGITGKLIAELANEEQPSHDIAPFSPARFL